MTARDFVASTIAVAYVLGLGIAMERACSAAPARADDGLDLAIAGIHEASIEVSDDELAAMWGVAQSRCHTRSPLRCLMRRLFGGRTSRAYLLMLRRDGRRPDSWPLRWYPRRRVVDVIARADRVVAGEVISRCRAVAWGSPTVDRERLARFADRLVDCGDTVNRYVGER